MTDLFSRVRFLGSAATLADCDRIAPKLPEVAVVGRSNVGKSSLLNTLFRRKGMAKTSNTPGKTRTLNYFQVGDQLLLVDLPGYGYAQVSQKVKAEWSKVLDTYLNDRPKLIVFLLDLRRTPSQEDRALVAWAQAVEMPLVVAFTKSDKLPRTRRLAQAKRTASDLGIEDQWVLSSAKEGTGRNELAAAIQAQMGA